VHNADDDRDGSDESLLSDRAFPGCIAALKCGPIDVVGKGGVGQGEVPKIGIRCEDRKQP